MSQMIRKALLKTGIEDLRYKYYKKEQANSGKRDNEIYNVIRAKFCRDKLYLPYLDLPVTTCCTLCCEHCFNIMQYYSNPAHIPLEKIINNLSKICASVDGILNLHILGGEPFLYPHLDEVLEFCIKEEKIKHIKFFTNGTLLIPSSRVAPHAPSVVDLLAHNAKVTVMVSNYGKNSYKMQELIAQMEDAHIQYVLVNDGVLSWRARASLLYRGWDTDELKALCENCVLPSLFGDELHICARSAHGTDLGAVPKREEDYVRFSQYDHEPAALREAIYKLLDRRRCEACQYCLGCVESIIRKYAVTVTPAGQCSRSAARECFQQMMEENRSRLP